MCYLTSAIGGTIEPALTGRLVGSPLHQLRPVPEAIAGDVVELHLDHELAPSAS
jgi:hypothetical protein